MDILYTDDCLLLVDKPAGMPVLPDGWDAGAPYLLQLLEQDFERLWVVHRLDKATSGVMAFARTAQAHRALSMQFERHQARKIYHAICTGAPKWDEHTAKHPLRVNVGHKHRTAVDPRNGKPAETRFKVLKRMNGYGLLESTPMTGRTHQIRVHAYALGHPLLGDLLYGAPHTNLITRPALHACSLTLAHPATNENLTFTVPYPPDFESALKNLGSPVHGGKI